MPPGPRPRMRRSPRSVERARPPPRARIPGPPVSVRPPELVMSLVVPAGPHRRPELDHTPRLREPRGDLLGPLARCAVDDEEAGQLLLRLRVGPVGGQVAFS